VQGSKHEWISITSEQRTDGRNAPRLRRFAPDNAQESAGAIRNKSGTAEVLCAFVSFWGQRRFLFLPKNAQGSVLRFPY
jgi:hypothetical protein